MLQRHWSLLWPETDHQTPDSSISRNQNVNMLCCRSAGVHFTPSYRRVLFSEVFQGCVGRCQFKTGCWNPAILTTLTIVMITLWSSRDLLEFNSWMLDSCTLCCVVFQLLKHLWRYIIQQRIKPWMRDYLKIRKSKNITTHCSNGQSRVWWKCFGPKN